MAEISRPADEQLLFPVSFIKIAIRNVSPSACILKAV